jgi:DNA modification methylase
MEVLAGLEADRFDAVVTDPPWNLGKDYGAHDDAMPSDVHVEWLAAVLAQCGRVSRGPVVFLPGAHIAGRVPELLRRAGLAHAATLTWRKPAPEPVVWAGAQAPSADVPRVIEAREPPAGAHPCPKPVELMAALVEATTPAGGVVLDPFAGSGTTLIAAAALGRSAVGIEIHPRYAALARRRTRA